MPMGYRPIGSRCLYVEYKKSGIDVLCQVLFSMFQFLIDLVKILTVWLASFRVVRNIYSMSFLQEELIIFPVRVTVCLVEACWSSKLQMT